MKDPSKKSLCEEEVFSDFYGRHSRNLFNFMFYKCGNSEQASDYVQEAFLKVFENCSKIIPLKAKSFLFTTANNLFLNVKKHEKVQLAYRQQQPADDFQEEDPHFVLREKEYMEQLQNAIANLTDAQREVFLLNRIDGKKYREIAEMLNISQKAVEKRMTGALIKLREVLGNNSF
jgi:RNA polymerase sigma factor (sigma-70 family)